MWGKAAGIKYVPNEKKVSKKIKKISIVYCSLFHPQLFHFKYVFVSYFDY